MRLVKFAVKRPVTITILVAVILITGFLTYSRMPLDLLPEMTLPVVAVISTYPGAGPEEVESQVSEPLESILNNVSNIKELHSTSSEGQSTILVLFEWETDMDTAALDVREKIAMVEKYLPDEVDKPMVIKMDPSMLPVIQLGLSGSHDLAQLQKIAEDVIEPRLSRIPEVSSVIMTGGLEREIKVEVDPVKVENYGLTLGQVTGVLRAENFNMSGGKVEQGGREYFVRNLQQFESLEDIRNVAILTSSGNTIYLKDIATIVDGYKDDPQLTRVNGVSAVGIHCLKQTDANTVTVSREVQKELEKIKQELGGTIDVKVIFDQADFVEFSIKDTLKIIVEGALLAMLVLFLFLRSVRSTLIIFTSIPLAIIATFIVMYFNNSTINLITMGGLALGVGRIVDDSIVVFENIYRHRALGVPPLEAAINGASEVGNAVIAATLTLIAVFLPVAMVEGITSILFRPLAMTVCVSVFASLLIALTIIPLLSSRMLTDKAMEKKEAQGRIMRMVQGFGQWLDGLGDKYKSFLEICLQRRRRVIIIVTVLLVASLAAVPLVGAEFMPKVDAGEISITIEADKGNKVSDTDKIVRQVEKHIQEIPEMETVFTSVGNSANMAMESGTVGDQAAIHVKLCSKTKRQRSVDTVAEDIRQRLGDVAGAKIKVSVMDAATTMGSSEGPINVQIRGDDMDVLRELSEQVKDIVRTVPGTREVVSSITDGKPEIQVKVDRQRAATYGLTPGQIASEVNNAMQGKVATRYKVEGEEVDVRVRYIPEGHDNIDYLSNLTILTPSGAVIRLGQVATFEMAQGPIKINRIDQVRRADINGYLWNRDLKGVMDDIKLRVDKIELPAGYTVEYGGENKDMMETFTNLALALVLAIILVYAVMAIQYESFFDPFVIMFSVPTAFIGVVLGLLLTGRSFSVPAFIGVIMLVGVVVSNAIVFVDYLKQMREKGMERDAAIIETGRVRLRPILMTAFATILAMIPLSLGISRGGEFQAPLATVVIGGLLVSTLVTLVLVPVVYSIFDDWGQKLGWKFTRRQLIEEDKPLDA